MKKSTFLSFIALLLCLQTIHSQKTKKEDKQALDTIKISGLKWRSIGPSLTSGRISDIAVNPNNPFEYYVASSAGGVWKTINSGIEYTPVFDGEGSFSIGCVTIDPNNTNVVWVGSGENNNQRSVNYGDGVSNIDIGELLKFHRSHGKMVTVSGVHPLARFGELEISKDQVTSFQEKPQTTQGWINGGYFVIEPEFLELIESDDIVLEKTPLESAAKNGELMAYHHNGFWQCMDTKRDRDSLDKMCLSGNPPWKV